MTPAGVMRPILLLSNWVNHTFPSAPAASGRRAPGSGSGNSVITPAVVMRPILPPAFSQNQRLPSGPATMPSG